MKLKSINAPVADRKSKQENLPLLRGMFVGPDNKKKESPRNHKVMSYAGISDDELFRTSDQVYYLGE